MNKVKHRSMFVWWALIVVCIIAMTGCTANDTNAPAIPGDTVEATVERVVDGDTFITDKKQKVRLIGINTPESVDPRRPVEFYGKEASRFAQNLLEGKKVRMQWGRTPKDKYGRWLAWVWLSDGTFINGELVAKGYAQVYTFKDNPDYAEYLRQLQKEAREKEMGLWAPVDNKEEAGTETASPSPSSGVFLASKNSNVYHEQGCPGAEQIEPHNLISFKTEAEAQATGRRMCNVSGCRQ